MSLALLFSEGFAKQQYTIHGRVTVIASRVSYVISILYSTTMNSILQRYSGSNAGLSKSTIDEDNDFSDAMWGSEAGFGTLAKGVPGFVVPSVPDVGLLLSSSVQLKTTCNSRSLPHS